MQLAMIGLGRMGSNMARRLVAGGHEVVGFNRSPEAATTLAREGVRPARTLAQAVEELRPPRTLWIMVPSGEATEAAVRELGALCSSGDLLVDGGNTHFKDDLR